MNTKTKEQIYDERISPLMTQIIAICKDYKIAMLCTFSIPNEDDPRLVCTTSLLSQDYEPLDEMIEALGCLRRPPAMAIAETHTTNPDGTRHISIRRVS